VAPRAKLPIRQAGPEDDGGFFVKDDVNKNPPPRHSCGGRNPGLKNIIYDSLKHACTS